MSDVRIQSVTEGIWSVDAWARWAPGAHMPCRATIVRLSSGGLLIHSPVPFTEESLVEIGKLGEVTNLLAPNLYHHMFLTAAQERFSTARTLVPRGLCQKVDGLHADEVIEASLPPDLAKDFQLVPILGAPLFNELVLFHRATRTLLVCDFFFNIQKTRGLLAPVLLTLTGTHKKAAQSRLWRTVTREKALMKASAAAISDLDFRRVIMCHGEILEDGREMAKNSLAWLGPD
jgi:hypothetical protein